METYIKRVDDHVELISASTLAGKLLGGVPVIINCGEHNFQEDIYLVLIDGAWVMATNRKVLHANVRYTATQGALDELSSLQQQV